MALTMEKLGEIYAEFFQALLEESDMRATHITVDGHITGTSTTPTAFSTGLADSVICDVYISTATGSIGNVYQCTLGGDEATALWQYKFTIPSGTDGADAQVHTRYSNNEPTSDSDIYDTPTTDTKWIGVYSGASETAPTAYTAYDWIYTKGQKGDRCAVYYGSAITGISTTPTAYATGLDAAEIGDHYVYNGTDDAQIGNEYICTIGGDTATALWIYLRNMRGPSPEIINVLTSDDTDKALSAAQGKALNDGKANIITSPVENDFISQGANGDIQKSGYKASDFVASSALLSSDVEYYVNSDTEIGSDDNDGSSDYPFLTIQHAIDQIPNLLYGHNPTIHITGTFATETLTINNRYLGYITLECNGSVAVKALHVNNAFVQIGGINTPSFLASSDDIALYMSNATLGVLNGITAYFVTSNSAAICAVVGANSLLYGEYTGYLDFDGGNWGLYVHSSRCLCEASINGENHVQYGMMSLNSLIQVGGYTTTNVGTRLYKGAGGLIKTGAGIDLT